MKKTIADLNDSLFETLNRLTSANMDEDALDLEIRRAEAVTSVAQTILHSGEIQLKALKIGEEYGYFTPTKRVMPQLLENNNGT